MVDIYAVSTSFGVSIYFYYKKLYYIECMNDNHPIVIESGYSKKYLDHNYNKLTPIELDIFYSKEHDAINKFIELGGSINPKGS